MGFFDHYDRFYKTSETSPFPDRLNARHEAIIAGNADRLAGKRLLDIASHDGRWSFAALKAGAGQVVGIEPRGELIANARETFAHYGIPADTYEFQQGDVFDLIKRQRFDAVLCLGFYYHTIRHAELLNLIERTGAKFVVIDTEVTPTVDQVPVSQIDDPRIVYRNPYGIQLLRDPVAEQQMATSDSMTRDGYTLVGRPSRAAVEFMARHFGYSTDLYPWKRYFHRNPRHAPSMVDYSEGWRETFFLSR